LQERRALGRITPQHIEFRGNISYEFCIEISWARKGI
jgi:hypothetical protein